VPLQSPLALLRGPPRSLRGLLAPLQRARNPSAHNKVVREPLPASEDNPDAGPASFRLQFRINSARLDPKTIPFLDTIGELLHREELKGYSFVVEGHTDASGSEVYNRDLSQRRAEVVRNYLVEKHGIEGQRLAIRGLGKSRPMNRTSPYDTVNRRFAVDLYGDDLIHFGTGSPVTRRPAGKRALVENNGIIEVEGGRVLITAAAAEGIVDQAIKVGGKISARSAHADGGVIVLDGGDSGTLAVTGTLNASSSAGRGGKIDIRGRKIRLGRKSLVKASGSAGGGDIRIGGDRGGQGPGRNADRVILASEAQVIADATGVGDGGSIIVYGKDRAKIDGTLTARGGKFGGDGGFIETSAVGTIDIESAQVDASAPAGKPGTWLIDPADIKIDSTNASQIVNALEGGSNVVVTTTGTTPPANTKVKDPDTPGFEGVTLRVTSPWRSASNPIWPPSLETIRLP